VPARVAPAAVLLLALVLLTGCGGNDKVKEANAYVAAVNRAQTRFAGTIQRVGNGIGGTAGTKATAATVTKLSAAVDRVVAELKAVPAPGRVAALHHDLVGEISGFGTSLRRARRGFASKDPVAILEERQRLIGTAQRVMTQINTTIARINRSLRT
jgi:hypothetical protein